MFSISNKGAVATFLPMIGVIILFVILFITYSFFISFTDNVSGATVEAIDSHYQLHSYLIDISSQKDDVFWSERFFEESYTNDRIFQYTDAFLNRLDCGREFTVDKKELSLDPVLIHKKTDTNGCKRTRSATIQLPIATVEVRVQ